MTASRRTEAFASFTIITIALTILIVAGAVQATAQSTSHLPRPADLPRADESGRVPVNDIEMWYAIFNKGGGDPVLLIHGGLGSADIWGNQIRPLIKTDALPGRKGELRSRHAGRSEGLMDGVTRFIHEKRAGYLYGNVLTRVRLRRDPQRTHNSKRNDDVQPS